MKIISFTLFASIAYTSSAMKPTPSPVGQNSCCIDTGVCDAATYSYDIPILNLSDGSSDKPTIDGSIDHLGDDIGDSPPIMGWIGNEYSRFLELPMYNGGKNGGGSPRIGTAYLAYDCANKVVCAAAHLDISFLTSNPTVQVDQDNDESWIRFGENNGAARLRATNSDEFAYIGKPDDNNFVIGYEGCWSVDSIRRIESVTNNFVEVHFTNNGDTTSTGKPAANGEFVCLKPDCDESTRSPSISPTINVPPISNLVTNPPTGSPAAPTSSPSNSPSLSPSVAPTALPSASPSRSPTKSPSSSPSVAPTASPSADPSNSPSNSPSLSPSTAPSTSPSAAPTSSPSKSPSLSPSTAPSTSPSAAPSSSPSNSPSLSPSTFPSETPTAVSERPSAFLSDNPSVQASSLPSSTQSMQPSTTSSSTPSTVPSESLSESPSLGPSSTASAFPSQQPSAQSSTSPSGQPSVSPFNSPSANPSAASSASPSESPSLASSDSPSRTPSAAPSDLQTARPSSASSDTPSVQASSLPSSTPSMQPSTTSSSTPSIVPSESLSESPSLSPSSTASTFPSQQPSAQSSSSPSGQPSVSPFGSRSETPSAASSASPSESPSLAPSDSPSGTPSAAPSDSLTARPSGRPSVSPSGSPSDFPSHNPSSLSPSATPSSSHGPTTSLAPSRLGSGLYFPNCFTGEGGPAVCIIDVGKYELPSATPMYTSLQDCCVGFYAWNFDECMGNGPSNKFFPDWRSEEDSVDACILDDGTHTVPKGTPKYDTLQECCDTHYSWNSDICNGVQAGPSNKYFPNWDGTDHVCLLDDGINVLPASAPLFEDLASCCDSQYSWNLAQCNGVTGPSNKYFPNWDGADQTCLLDDGSNTIPFAAPLFDDLLSCCESQYSWKLDECNTLAP